MIGAHISERPAFAAKFLDQLLDSRSGIFPRGVFVAIGDDSDHDHHVLDGPDELSHSRERESHRVEQRGRTTRLVILRFQGASLPHRDLVEMRLGLATAERHQRHEMLLRIGKFLLRLLDAHQRLVKTIDCRSPDATHRPAPVEDNHVVHLRLCHFLFFLFLFHSFFRLIVVRTSFPAKSRRPSAVLAMVSLTLGDFNESVRTASGLWQTSPMNKGRYFALYICIESRGKR